MRTVTNPHGTFQVYNDLVGTTIESGMFWDEQIRPFLDRADPAGWALDLGANVGWFSVYLARRHRGVLAVEAHPGTFALLQANCTLNGVASIVSCVNRAAYDRATTLNLAPDDYLGWAVPNEGDLSTCPSPASIGFIPDGSRLAVPAQPVDEMVQHLPVSLIKVDVQGADLRALYGLSQTIARCRPLVAFEFEEGASAWHGDTWEDYERFWAERNYQVDRVREDLWDFTATPKESI